MKKIGMIGGLSWLSAAEYYRRVNELVQGSLGGDNSAHLVMESVNREEFLDYVFNKKDEDLAAQMVLNAVKSVEAAGAEFIVFFCNGIHRYLPVVRPQISIPFLHIADATAEEIKKEGLKTVALLGVRATMEGTFFTEVLKSYGIETIIPNDEERDIIQDFLMTEVLRAVFKDETRQKFVDIIRALHGRGAEGAVLGCTEIPLLVRPGDVGIPTFSTTEIHCRATVERSLAA
jgi:aspartate racemase